MAQSARRREIVPQYPTRQEAELQPQRVLPGASEGLIGTVTRIGLAGGLLLVGLWGCDQARGEDAPKLGPEEFSGREKEIPPYAGSATVAPVFEHGDGRAADGCVVVTPPVFMSEEDARSVIREELVKLGIKPDQQDQDVKDVSILETEHDKASSLNADLIDSGKKIVVEFVSEADYFKLGGHMASSTVQSYDFKTVAKKVSLQIEKQNHDPKRFFAVFYDPAARRGKPPELPDPDKVNSQDEWKQAMQKYVQDDKRYWERGEQDALDASKEQLRQQVRDFAKWLKDKGVL